MTLSRSTGLKRTGFSRVERKEASAVKKIRAKKCAACRELFEPPRPSAKVCGEHCAEQHAMALKAKAERKAAKAVLVAAKVERKADKVRKDALKRRADWVAEAQVAFNAWVRYRDRNQPCICCGKVFADGDLPGGTWDAGHYLSRGHAPHLRFDERNVHRQVKGHNRPGGTTRESFRRGMEARIGIEALLALESDDTPRKHTIDELKAIKVTYQQKLKQLKSES